MRQIPKKLNFPSFEGYVKKYRTTMTTGEIMKVYARSVLENLQEQFQECTPRKHKYSVFEIADKPFSCSDGDVNEGVKETLKRIDVSVLVNEFPRFLCEVEDGLQYTLGGVWICYKANKKTG